MDKRYLNKVMEQIVSETEIDYEKEKIYPPNSNVTNSYSFPSILFRDLLLFHSTFSLPNSLVLPFFFIEHCMSVYGLNNKETIYMWREYLKIIKDKIENNGL